MAALYSIPMIRALIAPTAVGATIGIIVELLSNNGDPGLKFLESTVTGVAFGIIKYQYGSMIAVPVLVFALIARVSITGDYSTDTKIKRYVGITLIGALIGYGLSCIPPEFWKLPKNTRLHLHVGR